MRGKRVLAIGKCSTLEISQALQEQAEKELSFYREEPPGQGESGVGVGWAGRLTSQLMEEYSSRRSAARQEGLLGEVVPSSMARGWGPQKERSLIKVWSSQITGDFVQMG